MGKTSIKLWVTVSAIRSNLMEDIDRQAPDMVQSPVLEGRKQDVNKFMCFPCMKPNEINARLEVPKDQSANSKCSN